MRARINALLLAALAAVATLASSGVPSKVHLVYPGTEDCASGCNFVAGGWPWPYLIDSHGISVHGSVSISGGLLGEDIIDPLLLGATYFSWLGILSILFAIAWALRTRRQTLGAVHARE